LPAKRKPKLSSQEEQTELLRMMLAKLQAINANMLASRPATPATAELNTQEKADSDDEELEYFE
jgi:hypothetical protein